MKKLLSLFISAMAIVALSGCAGIDDGSEQCNVVLRYVNSSNGSGSASSIRLDNYSNLIIDHVYSGINGNTEVSSVYIPTGPGEYFIANSQRCGDDEILVIIDREGCEQSVNFYRACDETANFSVDDR